MSTLLDAIRDFATSQPDRPALLEVTGDFITFRRLWQQLEHLAAQLHGLGVKREHRIAVALPNGFPASVTLLAVSGVSVCTPLNPNNKEDEYLRYFEALGVDGLIVGFETGGAAQSAASRLNIPVWELLPSAGMMVSLAHAEPVPGNPPRWAQANDHALLIHTSGTTAQPKQVLLTHRNVLASARDISRWLSVTEDDRCLNVVPLYHVSGLISSLAVPLISGSSVVCTSGFSVADFTTWLSDLNCTWTTAVPSMYQSLVAWLQHSAPLAPMPRLRFLRSGAATLPPSTKTALESLFGVPVIDAYGMTETASGILSNPLPPRPRKAGSVGLSMGADVAILGPDDAMTTTPCVCGEIIVRGDAVITAYGGQADAYADSFIGGWLRTGDLGYFDEDGYLFINGRRREMINRAGETISPKEVDEALLTHPAVAQALAFALPDERLGEAVAAVVVLHHGQPVTQDELRHHAQDRLADFKVPSTIVFMDSLPLGPSGKPQRIGLAERLGLSAPDPSPPVDSRAITSELAVEIAAIWREVLRVESLAADTTFLDLGGDSIQAVRIGTRLRDHFGGGHPDRGDL